MASPWKLKNSVTRSVCLWRHFAAPVRGFVDSADGDVFLREIDPCLVGDVRPVDHDGNDHDVPELEARGRFANVSRRGGSSKLISFVTGMLEMNSLPPMVRMPFWSLTSMLCTVNPEHLMRTTED